MVHFFVFWYKIRLDHNVVTKVANNMKFMHNTGTGILFSVFLDPDPHNRRPLGSGSAWTDAGPDPGGDKLKNKTENCRY